MESKLATKFIPNKKDFNELVRRLSVAVDNVSRKPVFVVEKRHDVYNVVNHLSGDAKISGLPTRQAARKACQKFNKNPEYRYSYHALRKIERLCDDIQNKQYTVDVYKQNLKAGLYNDYDITLTKLTEEKSKLEYLKDQLMLLA